MVVHSLGYAAFLTDPITWAVLAIAAGAARPLPRARAPPRRPPASLRSAAMLDYLRRLATTGAAYTAASVLSKLLAVALLPLYTSYV